jgi:hypothetical protein
VLISEAAGAYFSSNWRLEDLYDEIAPENSVVSTEMDFVDLVIDVWCQTTGQKDATGLNWFGTPVYTYGDENKDIIMAMQTVFKNANVAWQAESKEFNRFVDVQNGDEKAWGALVQDNPLAKKLVSLGSAGRGIDFFRVFDETLDNGSIPGFVYENIPRLFAKFG